MEYRYRWFFNNKYKNEKQNAVIFVFGIIYNGNSKEKNIIQKINLKKKIENKKKKIKLKIIMKNVLSENKNVFRYFQWNEWIKNEINKYKEFDEQGNKYYLINWMKY
jgi:hypothetical protein